MFATMQHQLHSGHKSLGSEETRCWTSGRRALFQELLNSPVSPCHSPHFMTCQIHDFIGWKLWTAGEFSTQTFLLQSHATVIDAVMHVLVEICKKSGWEHVWKLYVSDSTDAPFQTYCQYWWTPISSELEAFELSASCDSLLQKGASKKLEVTYNLIAYENNQQL